MHFKGISMIYDLQMTSNEKMLMCKKVAVTLKTHKKITFRKKPVSQYLSWHIFPYRQKKGRYYDMQDKKSILYIYNVK